MMSVVLTGIVNRSVKHIRKIFVVITIVIHLFVLLFFSFSSTKKQHRTDNTIFKIVDVHEFIPPQEKKEKVMEVQKQNRYVEDVIATDKTIIEVDIDYVPQHKVTEVPKMPSREIRSRIIYPQLATKKGIEGVVFLELYVDAKGIIRDIVILKNPGYGFAEAAIAALQGITCIPALNNGKPVAVRFRYPIRFVLTNG